MRTWWVDVVGPNGGWRGEVQAADAYEAKIIGLNRAGLIAGGRGVEVYVTAR